MIQTTLPGRKAFRLQGGQTGERGDAVYHVDYALKWFRCAEELSVRVGYPSSSKTKRMGELCACVWLPQ